MRKFEFKLDSVLKIQERKKKVAELRRQQSLLALTAAEAEVKRWLDELQQTADEFRLTLQQGGSPSVWQAYSSRSRWLDGQLAFAETQANSARADFALANEQYRKIAVAVEVLEQLRQKRWHEYQEEVAAQEQQRIEEFVLRRWQHQVAESGSLTIGRDGL